ncbi:MAG: DUF3820 family protein [Treponemataceae bacterium]
MDDFQNPAFLIKLANARMPFGKYSGRLLIDLPEAYVVWFAGKGWPEGEIGLLLASLYDIKANGLEGLLRPLVKGTSKNPVGF